MDYLKELVLHARLDGFIAGTIFWGIIYVVFGYQILDYLG